MQRFRWTTVHVVFLYVCGVLLGAQLVDLGMNLYRGEGFSVGGFLGLLVAVGLPILPAMHASRLAGEDAD